MTSQIQPGDVVILKSGGPIMTVTDVSRAYQSASVFAWCTWFDEAKNHENRFPLAALKKQDSGFD